MQNPDIFKPASRPVFSVDYGDLEQFVAKVYGKNHFEIIEVDNDTDIACDTGLTYFDAADIEHARERVEAGHCSEWEVNSIIKLLFKDGHITEGDYIVNVCW